MNSLPPENNMKNVMQSREVIRNWLKKIAADILKHQNKEIDSSKKLSEYGIDSVMALELIGNIENKYDCMIELEELAQHSSLNDIAGLIETRTM